MNEWTIREITLDFDQRNGMRRFEMMRHDTELRHVIEVCSQENVAMPDEPIRYDAVIPPPANAGLWLPLLELAMKLKAHDHQHTLPSA